MKKTAWLLSIGLLVAAAMVPGQASSHREAPLIALDPAADNTDVYAFVDPNDPDMVTLIANYIPFQSPNGGPNFYPFDPNVLYEIHVDNNGDAVEDVTFQWRFTTERRNPGTFLYNTGPVTTIDDADLNVRQFYSLTRVDGPRRTGSARLLSGRLPVPPPNIGPRSTPNYGLLAGGVQQVPPTGMRVFAGQRDEGFYVDLGIFDLLGVGSGADRGQHGGLQRQLAGDPGADGAAHPQRLAAERRRRSQRDHRRVGHVEPAGGRDADARRHHLQRRLGAGVAPRHAARQRSGDRPGAQGRVQLARADR